MAAAAVGCQATATLIAPPTPAKDSIAAVNLRIVLIPAPLPDVPQHVVQTKAIGRLQPHGMGALPGILCVPGDLVQVTVLHRAVPGATGVFPLGVSGQAKPATLPIPMHVLISQLDVVHRFKIQQAG